MDKLSNRLKELRQSKHLKQYDISNLLNITTRNYQEYEYSKVTPPLISLIKLADYFDVSLDYLVGRSDDPKRY